MLPAITKPLESLTADDLQDLIQRRWPESENVEYKEGLHRERPDQQDSWYTGGNISAPSKNKIFKELVAFANTSGGRLFLGLAETDDKPPCANAIHSIPRCSALAERLEQSIASSIDPPLTFFRVVGIPIDGDSGVVIAEVSASYNGPHRSPDLNCYVRRGTNSVPVGMREIHDMVMRLSRRQDEIQRRLSERAAKFRSWIGIGAPHPHLFTGFRVTAVPVGAPLYLKKVFSNREVSRGFPDVTGKWTQNPGKPAKIQVLSPVSLTERAILGGTAWVSKSSDDRSGQKSVLRDGWIDMWFSWPWYQAQHWPSQKSILPLEWIIAASADVIASAERFKQAAQAPGCEYGLQLELLSTNGPAEVPILLAVSPKGFIDPFNSAFATPAILGPYSVGDRDAVMNLIVRDLLDASGEGADWPRLEIDWSSVSAPS